MSRFATTRWRAEALVAVLVVPPLIHLAPLHRLGSLLGRSRTGRQPPLPVERAVDWVDRLLHRLPWPWRFTCLKRSAVLFVLLRRHGIPVGFRIGVRREPDGALAAHAWLVQNGEPYLEPAADSLPGYQVIARFPEGSE